MHLDLVDALLGASRHSQVDQFSGPGHAGTMSLEVAIPLFLCLPCVWCVSTLTPPAVVISHFTKCDISLLLMWLLREHHSDPLWAEWEGVDLMFTQGLLGNTRAVPVWGALFES